MSNERMDLGVIKAARAFLDSYGLLKVMGYNKNGEVNHNPAQATPAQIKNFANSVDISGYELYQDQGLPFAYGHKSGTRLDICRNSAGDKYKNISDKNCIYTCIFYKTRKIC